MNKALPYIAVFLAGLCLGFGPGLFLGYQGGIPKGKNEILEGRLLPEVSFALGAVMEIIQKGEK